MKATATDTKAPANSAAEHSDNATGNGHEPATQPPRPRRSTDPIGAMRSARDRASQPMEDYGWFGPDSVTWRVWSYPTSLTVGFSRSVVVEELDPFLVAAVDATSKIYSQPRIRYDRTLKYFATLKFGDSRSIVKASEVLVKVHAKAVGTEPVSGLTYDANSPDSQLWIHLTAWHSILFAYEKYGPGKLSEEDERRYWEECAIAAQAQTIDPAAVPRTRDGIRAYFEGMRPRLAASEATQRAMDHLMNAEVMFPPLPAAARPFAWALAKTLRVAIIATLPRWQRELGGIRQPRPLDVLIRPLMRLSFRTIAASPRLELALLALASPATVPVAGPMLLGIKPLRQETLTPAESFKRHGVPTPKEVYAELRRHPEPSVAFAPSAPAHAAGAR
jgi:uncharacterized protein (DUF2236 family)